MTSYWDYLKKDWHYGPVLSFAKARYDQAWDESHGSNKYWLSKVPIWGQMKKWEDEAQQWQDQYNNTGKDPTYSTAYGNSSPFGASVGMAAGAAGAAKMVFSLSEMYSAEVVADVGYNVNKPMYG